MATETLTIGYAAVPGFPAGSVVQAILVAMVGTNTANNQSQTLPPATATAVFNSVNPDTYTVTASGVDASGNTFGTPATATIVIAAPTTVTLELPTSIAGVQS
jgi:hypothetical protein